MMIRRESVYRSDISRISAAHLGKLIVAYLSDGSFVVIRFSPEDNCDLDRFIRQWCAGRRGSGWMLAMTAA
jgi:hypothetical protein